jgi:hypothetical protein
MECKYQPTIAYKKNRKQGEPDIQQQLRRIDRHILDHAKEQPQADQNLTNNQAVQRTVLLDLDIDKDSGCQALNQNNRVYNYTYLLL